MCETQRVKSDSQLHDDFICCGHEMTPTGFQSGNGWVCEYCGHREFDVASFKMGGN